MARPRYLGGSQGTFGRTVRGTDFFSDAHRVTEEDKKRYQRALDASIRNAEKRLKWHKAQGHSGAARRRGFSLLRHNTRPRYRGH